MLKLLYKQTSWLAVWSSQSKQRSSVFLASPSSPMLSHAIHLITKQCPCIYLFLATFNYSSNNVFWIKYANYYICIYTLVKTAMISKCCEGHVRPQKERRYCGLVLAVSLALIYWITACSLWKPLLILVLHSLVLTASSKWWKFMSRGHSGDIATLQTTVILQNE